MSKLLYFAYGSNLHPNWLRSRTPSARLLGPARLTGYRLHFNKPGLDDSGKCNIIRSTPDRDAVHGVVYEFPLTEKPVLDAAEKGYQERFLDIGEYRDVLLYHCEESSHDTHAPYSWYQDIVIAGAMLHSFPDAYLAHIRSYESKDDPDSERELNFRRIVWP